MPGRFNFPEAKYSISVDAKPILITSIPWLITPSEKASASNGDDGRISSPTTIVAGSRSYSKNLANAIPSENEKSGVTSSLTKPLMSYALIIFSNLRLLTFKFFKF
jgi:hypothetical protein